MIVYPNAKINIGLNITEKRKDGFHNIETVFYPVPLCDILEVIIDPEGISGSIHFYHTGIHIGENEHNLCVKAYKFLHEKYNIPAVKSHLHKKIPIGAGLGGGSSDAAFMLKALNELLQLNIKTEHLKQYAEKLGSDCAFFIDNEPSLAFEKGNVLEAINLDLGKYKIVLVYPDIHINTTEAYSGISPQPSKYKLSGQILKTVNEWKGYIKNDFENHIFNIYPEIKSIKEQLYKIGAVYASMSGSGSSVYGIFEETSDLPELPFQNYWILK